MWWNEIKYAMKKSIINNIVHNMMCFFFIRIASRILFYCKKEVYRKVHLFCLWFQIDVYLPCFYCLLWNIHLSYHSSQGQAYYSLIQNLLSLLYVSEILICQCDVSIIHKSMCEIIFNMTVLRTFVNMNYIILYSR